VPDRARLERAPASEQFWLNLQARYDLEIDRDRLGTRLEAEVAVYAGSAA
jgi:plasmid maintenance system antidote protein VapI